MSLITPRTICTPLSDIHVEKLMKMYSEKDSFKYISPLKGKEPEYYKAFIQRSINANQLETCVWSVNLKSGEFIGTINLNYSEVIEGFQIGCHLKRDYWGNGFAKELFHELIRFAFEERKLPEIGSIYETNNLASAKLMQLFQLEIQSVKMEGEIEIAICKLANPF